MFGILVLVISTALGPLASAEVDSLFERATRAIKKIDPDTLLGDCVYDLKRTFVSEVKLENFCGGKTVRICNARIVCRTGAGRELKSPVEGLSMGVTCLADGEGTCPASADQCIDGKGLNTVLKGEAAITSGKANKGLFNNGESGSSK